MGLAGKERIESIFSIEIMLNKYISLYHNVMSAR
jgi:hypothetical protein